MTDELEDRELIRLPPDLIAALGDVTARYGQIEYLLTLTIRRTQKEEMPYSEAMEEFRNLKEHNEDRAERVKSAFRDWAIKKFGKREGQELSVAFHDLMQHWIADGGLASRRHDLIHCCCSVGKEDKTPLALRRNEFLKWDGQLVRVKEIERLADQLKQFVVRLNATTREDQKPDPAKLPGTTFLVDYVMPSNVETFATIRSTDPILTEIKDRSKD